MHPWLYSLSWILATVAWYHLFLFKAFIHQSVIRTLWTSVETYSFHLAWRSYNLPFVRWFYSPDPWFFYSVSKALQTQSSSSTIRLGPVCLLVDWILFFFVSIVVKINISSTIRLRPLGLFAILYCWHNRIGLQKLREVVYDREEDPRADSGRGGETLNPIGSKPKKREEEEEEDCHWMMDVYCFKTWKGCPPTAAQKRMKNHNGYYDIRCYLGKMCSKYPDICCAVKENCGETSTDKLTRSEIDPEFIVWKSVYLTMMGQILSDQSFITSAEFHFCWYHTCWWESKLKCASVKYRICTKSFPQNMTGSLF